MVLCSGCFDGLHIGHIAYLQAAAQIEDSVGGGLMVAVANDAYIRRWKHREPRWSCADRMAVVGAIHVVQGVIAHDEHGAAEAILTMRPFVFAKGSDWSDRGGVPPDVAEACQTVGARVVYVQHPYGRHTSETVQ